MLRSHHPFTRRGFLASGLCAACAGGLAVGPTGIAVAEPPPFGFRAWGSFRAMVREGRTEAVVGLSEALAAGVTDAVGAVARFEGEATILDGRPIISLGGGCPASCDDAGATGVALLAGACVRAWREPVSTERDLDEAGWRAFVTEAAGRAGIGAGSPFPFRIEGDLLAVTMHVNRGPSAAGRAGAGHGEAYGGGAHARQDARQEARLPGLVVGIHAGQGRDGLVSHFGDPFHCHWVDPGRTSTAHLDRFGLAAGSRLFLPRA